VASVNGTTGEVYLVSIPRDDDVVLVSYYFKRSDTVHTDEDVSVQADGANTVFKVDYCPIVTPNNGGITTTTASDVSAKVNGSTVLVSAVDGDSGNITLVAAPLATDVVTVTYSSNEWQDTADILPANSVASVQKVGWTPTTSDFSEGTDFVVDSTGQFATLNWGASFKVASGVHTIGTTYFDSSAITPSLYDNKVYRRRATGLVDSTNKSFVMEFPPTDGVGLGIATDDTALIKAYVGTSPVDATQVRVVSLTSATKTITLRTAPDASKFVYVSQYANRLTDDVWTLTNKTAGAANVGVFTVAGTSAGTAHAIYWSSTDSSVNPSVGATTIPYLTSFDTLGTGAANGDMQVLPGYSTSETIRLTFADATSYTVSSTATSGTGTGADNTGYLNQTYVDRRTGFRVSIGVPAAGNFQLGDYIGYKSQTDFTCSPTGQQVAFRSIPGIKTTVAATTGIGVSDTGTVTTYNKDGDEPAIGDVYYTSFKKNKTASDYEAKIYLNENTLTADKGSINGTNTVVLAAHLCFLNGAPMVAVRQIQKTVGGTDAPDSAYITAIDDFDNPMAGGLRPYLLQPVTTSTGVLSYLKQSNLIQSGQRYANERMSYFGFPLNTSPTAAQTYARGMSCERMVGIYPDGAITTFTDALGYATEILVDGSILAAAVAGRAISPQFDVATPLTRKPITGFTRLYRRLDAVTAAQTANAGLMLLEEGGAEIIIKMDLTTDLTSVLTRTPSVVATKDFVQKGSRNVLASYIGTKFLTQRTGEIEVTLSSYMSALKQAQLIVDFTGIKATVDANDPTTVNVVAYYAPVLPLLWILITFNLRTKVS
jgi:hypothetical protein